ncbi:hypothetical protein [Chlorobium phaeobacteroides]|uniref:Uncharacterized protein n=1 Tax=Chlorobium phaeobacteroides (strain DSM 266 / SMG 266 / 2430) TaxID=290317 RepID=A1BEW8_CHLPD|nr:hypothetical protein [Chlorobium phaeobacteroides]ABL64945.1 hypothetical protein Cpha266_0897 [Chlorobium phaeobacteroides DSM 266]
MGIFSSKPVCRKFFTYATKTLDISGLSAGISPTELGNFDFKLGQFRSVPEFVRVSQRLYELDLQQYDLCQTIANISDKKERDRMFTQLAEIKMEMMRMAANPEVYESRELNLPQVEGQRETEKGTTETIIEPAASDANRNIMQLLDNPATIGEALIVAAKLPFVGDDRIRFQQKRQRYIDGLSDHERPRWVGEMKNFLAQYL